MKARLLIPIGLLVLLCGAAVASATLTAAGATPARPAGECPGTIVCPLDGETICKDRCPLIEEQAAAEPEPAACCAEALRSE